MQLTYNDVSDKAIWTNGEKNAPLGSALIWAKPLSASHAYYISITPSPDGTPFLNRVEKTTSIDSIINDAKRYRDADIIDASMICDAKICEDYVRALALAYTKGPDAGKPQSRAYSFLQKLWQWLNQL
mgnify:CR=1 FL=1